MRQVVWSSGGGVQSTAIAALICAGRIPVPNMAIIADTGREKSTTWEYLDDVVNPALRRAHPGFAVNRVSHELATVDLYSNTGRLLIPAFTSVGGAQGKLDTYCSNEWKRRVCQRYVRKHVRGDVDVWLGFSTDEIHRCKGSAESWWNHVFPLIEIERMSRADCEAVIRDAGWPTPPRSSCWMCPLMSDQEWRTLGQDDRQNAERLDREIRAVDADVWLHRSMRPVEDSPFTEQGDMFEEAGCRSGYCFT